MKQTKDTRKCRWCNTRLADHSPQDRRTCDFNRLWVGRHVGPGRTLVIVVSR